MYRDGCFMPLCLAGSWHCRRWTASGIEDSLSIARVLRHAPVQCSIHRRNEIVDSHEPEPEPDPDPDPE
jgi:hypothetical protein